MEKYLTQLNKKCHKRREFTPKPISCSQAREKLSSKELARVYLDRMMKVLLLLNSFILFKIILCDEGGVAFSKDSKNCGGTFSGFQYPVTSPNYPNNYPAEQDCVYILKGSQFAKCDQEFHLQFLDFQLEASKGCGKDYVKVGTQSVYCGNSIGIRKFKGQDNSLKLIFHSDTNTTAKGFRILVTTLPCASTELDPKQNGTVSAPKGDSSFDPNTETKGNVKNAYPLFHPEVEFDVEDEVRGDQPPSRIRIKPSSPKGPSENLELPEFQQHNFHNENCDHAHSVNDDGIGSITSYLYLPPAQLTRPLKITSAKIAPLNPGPNVSTKTIPNEVVIKNFEEDVEATEPSTDFLVPSHQIPPPSVGQVLQQTRNPVLQPLKHHLQSSSQFYEPNNRWLTYGTPNSVPSGNPSIQIPNDNNFDPFADGNINNNNPGVNYNPGSPANCGGGNNNPSYYPSNNNNNNGNWNPNSNRGENFPPGGNANPDYPNTNFGNGNGYADTGINFDTNFGVNSNNNPNYFDTNGNQYPNNNFYSPVDTGTTYYDTPITGAVSQCCGTRYSSSDFLIASPGFPALIYSSNNYECQYTIQRSSQNVCQLQMYLKFFNFGSDDQFCAYGHVEIDGNRICGCKTGANITSYFDNIATKTITVKYLGYPRNKFSGFVIEVTQVACSTNYLRFRNDQQYQNPSFITSYQRNYNKRSTSKVDEAEENGSDLRSKRDLGYHYQRPNSAALIASQNLQFLNSCRIFKFLNWVKAVKQVYLRNAQCSRTATNTNGVSSAISIIPIFPDTGNAGLINFPSSSNCETVNLVDGTISSPNYPNGYSNDLNQCYRFYKAPGYCQLELAMLDFNLEDSTICRKDYLSFSGQKRRYCGTSLAGSRTIFDMTQSSFADLYFVTDSSGTGRGFRAGFTQISC